MDKKNLHQNLLPHLFIVALLFTAFVTSSCNREIADSNTIDRLPTADEIDYRPADGDVSHTDPPAFICLPVEDTDSYILQYSSSKSFHAAGTTTVNGLTMTVHIPTSTIAEGTWYWRFGVKHG